MGRPFGSKNRISSLQKFALYYEVDEATGCWNWTKHVGKNGYGWFRQDGHGHAHRWAYAMFRAPIPPGLWVLHSCDNRRCVNPAHLFLTRSTASRKRQAGKMRAWWASLTVEERNAHIEKIRAARYKQKVEET